MPLALGAIFSREERALTRLQPRHGGYRAARDRPCSSLAEHGPNRVDRDEHSFRPILQAPESKPPIELHSACENILAAVVYDIQNNQLEADFAGDAQRARQRVHRKVRPEPHALPATVHRYHREVKRRNASGPWRATWAVRAKILCRHGMGVQRVVAENLRRPLGHRDEDPNKVVLLLLSGS